jgi:hypothetical protein
MGAPNPSRVIVLSMKALALFAVLFSVAPIASGQWVHTQHTDQLSGVITEQFKLDGKFLTAPRNAESYQTPSIILHCSPDPHANHSHERGTLVDGYIYIGAILQGAEPYTTTVEYRRDDNQPQAIILDVSDDFSSAFFSVDGLNYFLYGHKFSHKDGASQQARKLRIGLSEYVGNRIVAEFDLPDSTEVAEACGAIWHK